MAFSKITLDGTTLTKENFKNPPREMGILPFWFWNGELDEKELEWQMREYRKQGIPGLFIHGRFGLKVPYLSGTWFERVKYVVNKAKEIGIDVWIYDEMNWPSGTAERQVPRKYPHLKQKYLELVVLNVDGPLFTFLEATDSRYVNTGDSKPIACFACSQEAFENGISNLIDLTPNLSFNKVIPWEAPAGKWKLLYFLEKEIDYYIDTLNPESTQRFLELTHEGYKEAVGQEFGTIVPGFYTDEPAMYYYQVGVDNFVVPWSSQMFKIFRHRRGYDLKPFLPALYTSMGEITSKIRYDFWRTLTEQYADTYYKCIRDWCEANGVVFTGHLLFEEWLRGHARCEGNIFKYLKHLHLIGVDHLYPKIGTEQEPAEHVALKLASSAAHHFGSTRLLCESMGGTYWDCTLERMKWMANWEYVLGVNLFNNHGYHYSIEGERKRDWPPSQFYHHTWWKYYHQFTTYMTRLGHILSGGRHVAKLLILYPINSIWTNYTPQQRNPIGNVIESDFNYLTDTLLRLHYDFDFVDEDVLNAAKFADGKIGIANEEYQVLILPPLTHIKAATAQAIEEFIRCGGKVIADTLLPVAFLETEANDAAAKIESLFGVCPLELKNAFEQGSEFGVSRRDNAFVIHGQGLYRQGSKSALNRILEQCIAPDVSIANENVFYLHRIKDNFDIYFFVNTSQKNLGPVEISFEKLARPELWEPNLGTIKSIHPYQIRDGRMVLQLDFPAAEARIVVLKDEIKPPFITDTNLIIDTFDGKTITGFSDQEVAAVYVKIASQEGSINLTAQAKKIQPEILLGRDFKFHVEADNVLCLSRWKMALAPEDDPTHRYAATNFDDRDWLDVTQGAWEMQLPQERDDESYPVTLWYRTGFEIDDLPGNTRLLIDGFSGKEHRLFVNGHEITDKGQRSKLDAEINWVDIQPFLQKGANVVAVKLVVTRRTDGILDLLKIVGEFALAPTNKGYKIVASTPHLSIGDWTKQGYPFFSGTGIYELEIEVPESYLAGKLFLDLDCGEDVLEVCINDNESQVVPWHPYHVDVSDWIRAGKNKIVLKVTNTLINILEAVEKPSGIFEPPRLCYRPFYKFEIKA